MVFFDDMGTLRRRIYVYGVLALHEVSDKSRVEKSKKERRKVRNIE